MTRTGRLTLAEHVERIRAALKRLQPFGLDLRAAGWRPELVVFGPDEMPRIKGYKVGLIVPVDTPDDGSPSSPSSASPSPGTGETE